MQENRVITISSLESEEFEKYFVLNGSIVKQKKESDLSNTKLVLNVEEFNKKYIEFRDLRLKALVIEGDSRVCEKVGIYRLQVSDQLIIQGLFINRIDIVLLNNDTFTNEKLAPSEIDRFTFRSQQHFDYREKYNFISMLGNYFKDTLKYLFARNVLKDRYLYRLSKPMPLRFHHPADISDIYGAHIVVRNSKIEEISLEGSILNAEELRVNLIDSKKEREQLPSILFYKSQLGSVEVSNLHVRDFCLEGLDIDKIRFYQLGLENLQFEHSVVSNAMRANLFFLELNNNIISFEGLRVEKDIVLSVENDKNFFKRLFVCLRGFYCDTTRFKLNTPYFGEINTYYYGGYAEYITLFESTNVERSRSKEDVESSLEEIRTLTEIFSTNHMKSGEDRAYELHREEMFNYDLLYGVRGVYRKICNRLGFYFGKFIRWGHAPFNVFILIFGISIIFSGIYFLHDLFEPNSLNDLIIRSNYEGLFNVEVLDSIIFYILFSLSNSFSILLPDKEITDFGSWMYIISALQSVIGVILITVFVASITRKFLKD